MTRRLRTAAWRAASRVGASAVLLTGLTAFAAPADAVPITAPIDLGTLPGFTDSYPAAINDAGTVLGTATADDGARTRAVRWDSHGRITALALPDGRTDSTATAINNRGVAVGVVSTSGTGSFPVRWDQRGNVTELDALPGSESSWTIAINNAGVVIGQAAIPGALPRAVRWDAKGHVTDLGVLPGHAESRPSAINDAGLVSGISCLTEGGCRAVRWDRGGQIENLGTLPGDEGSAGDGMNQRGTVIGRSWPGGSMTAVWWDPAGRITAAARPSPDTTDMLLSGINRDDVIVGSVWRGPTIARGAQWDRSNHVTVLESRAAWVNTVASFINDAGTTAGMASTPDGTVYVAEWDSHGRISFLGTLPVKYYGSIAGLNIEGGVAGWSLTPEGHHHTLVWRR
jgi:YD repeat-containing protein